MSFRTSTYITLLAHAANEAVRLGVLDVTAPNQDPPEPLTYDLFDTALGTIPMRVGVRGWRIDETRIAVAAWPTARVDEFLHAFNSKELAGEVTAHGYVSRNPFGRLMICNPYDPMIFVRQGRRAALMAIPPASELSDPLGLNFERPYFNVAA